jgi:GT2 family glycosyltransferase
LGSIDFKKYAVLVVDNNSSDETISCITSNYEKVKLFEESSNLGFGQANNKGISYALQNGAEHVFLLNQDAYLVDDCLEKLVSFQKKNKNYGIVSPIHTNAQQNRLDQRFSNYVRYDKNPNFYSDHVLGNTIQEVYDVPFVNAAGWLISKACLLSVGGFDPIFYHYGEDDNYCQRVLYHDFKIGILSKPRLIHDREDRLTPEVELYSNAFFELEERRLKTKYANVETFHKTSLTAIRNKKRKQLLKAYIKQNRIQISANQKYLNLIDILIKQVAISVSLNQKKQPNYLDL